MRRDARIPVHGALLCCAVPWRRDAVSWTDAMSSPGDALLQPPPPPQPPPHDDDDPPELQALTPPRRKEPPRARHPPGAAAAVAWGWKLPWFLLAASVIETQVFAFPETRASLVFNPGRRREAWRFLSYMLVHSGALHLALNVVIQLLLAAPLELEQGHWRTGLVYLGGGLAGSLGTSLLEPDLCVEGASAGVYALLISHLAHLWLNGRALRYPWYRLLLVAALVLADVVFSVHHHLSTGNVGPRVCWAAHFAGALAGLLLGLAAFAAAPKPPAASDWPRLGARAASAALLGAALCAALVCNLLRADAARRSSACPRPL